MAPKNLASERIGTVNKNTNGSKMEVVEYNTYTDIWVKFEKGKPVHATWQAFLNGTVKNKYDRTVCGIGYLGEGNYKSKVNGKLTPQYESWENMLKRCYSEKYKERKPSYIDCKVDDRFQNFQFFSAWYDQNYYEIEGERMQLDKDILVKGNKIYSPDTCIFVPSRINSIFVCSTLEGELPKKEFTPHGLHKEKAIKQVAEEYKNKIPNKLYEAMMNY